MNYTVRDATPDDVEAMLPLFPRLAEFDLPPRRHPEQFWQEDADLLQKWSRGEAPQCFAKVAASDEGAIVGIALVSMSQDFFSHEPSAHLEALSIAKDTDGRGIGRALVAAAEASARARGALSMSLHVVGNNTRARHVYRKLGYHEELIRCVKHFDVE